MNMNNNYSNNRTPTTAAAAPLTPAPTLQDGVASLSACRGVIANLDERLQTAAGRLSEARERVLRAREAVSFTSFRLVATRARTSVSLAEVRVLRQIAEVQQKTSTAMTTTNVDKDAAGASTCPVAVTPTNTSTTTTPTTADLLLNFTPDQAPCGLSSSSIQSAPARLKRVMTEMAVIDEQIRASDDKAAQLRHDQLSAANKGKEAETAAMTRRSLAVKESTDARDTLRRRLEAWGN